MNESMFAAVDLGASSGRVMAATISSSGLNLREMHRFANRPTQLNGALRWDMLGLWAGVQRGLRAVCAANAVAGVGVDSWALDYGLLDADGRLIESPVHYRDARTQGVPELVDTLTSADTRYQTTGTQRLRINTVNQLVAARDTPAMRAASSLLMIPDLINLWLTGRQLGEITNASTTGLFDVRHRAWSTELCAELGLRADILPPVAEPGDEVGSVRTGFSQLRGQSRIPVWAVGSHDTASAVLAVPAPTRNFAYVSCGTWALVGVEADEPITTTAARHANFSNELGVDGTVRFLRNVMGLWPIQESIREWESAAGSAVDLGNLLNQAAEVPAGRCVIDVDRPEFLAPGDMPRKVREECRRTGQPEPTTPAEITRCIVDSLALAFARAVREAGELSGIPIEIVHVVGGGAQNALLCQLTADACGLPVVAGPVEATAYGNAMVQARAAEIVRGDRWRLRELLIGVRRVTYQPGR